MEMVYEGTWEEVVENSTLLERSRRLRVGLARAREIASDFPLVPERQIALDFLYPDEEDSRCSGV